MKKTYMIPTLQVVKIQPNQLMIVASGSTDAESGNYGRQAGFSDSDDWDE